MTTTENIRKELQDLVDSKYQEFHSALVPGIGNILGVRIPQLRILAKEIAKRDNWRMFVEATDTKFYEETMLQGMVIGLAKMELDERMKRISISLLPLISKSRFRLPSFHFFRLPIMQSQEQCPAVWNMSS